MGINSGFKGLTGRFLLQFLDKSIQDRWAYEGKLERLYRDIV